MIKYKIKHKIVNCENTDSVTSHSLYPSPCHKLSTFSDPTWSVTYFMDDPIVTPVLIVLHALASGYHCFQGVALPTSLKFSQKTHLLELDLFTFEEIL